MQLHIIKNGIADSIQDGGRYGYQHLGIQPSGYIDFISAWMGNYILENPLNNPLIEIHFPSIQIQFDETGIICITGANFIPVINDKSIALYTPIIVNKGDLLQFLQPIEGKTTYLAIQGDLKNKEWLGSYAGIKINKELDIQFQPFHEVNTWNTSLKKIKIESLQQLVFDHQNPIRIIPGPAWNDLLASSLTKIVNSPFTISPQANRMGYKILGPKIEISKPNEYLSSAVTRGTLQLLPNGEIIILMADHQTIGGYANLGQIILVDLPRFAQMKAGQAFHFSITNLQTAQQLYRNLYGQFKD